MRLLPKQRILPNGVKDEVNITDNKIVKKLNQVVFNGTESWGTVLDLGNTYRGRLANWRTLNNAAEVSGVIEGTGRNSLQSFSSRVSISDGSNYTFGFHPDTNLYLGLPKNIVDEQAGATIQEKFKKYIALYPITLTYQLARPKIYQSKFIY